ncbi:MAG TPA: 50S ribosomal protein L29 [Candidatus Gracilibacteria bacterium]|nr:50S ribosomal protein L29 [Candidatus Gracilibacteria bacterium]
MKISEIRLLPIEELVGKLQDARQELMNMRFQVVTGQLNDTSRLKVARRTVAQMETILKERKGEKPQEPVEGEKGVHVVD